MTLLGITYGFGNIDCKRLLLSAVDLDRGWITSPQPKTDIMRASPHWPWLSVWFHRRVGDDFATGCAMIATLPLADAENAETMRRLV